MMPFTALILAYFGFVGLALAMPRHYQQVVARPLAAWRRQLLGAGAWASLCASLLICVRHWNPALGITAWVGMLTVTAVSVALTLTYLPYVRRRALLSFLVAPSAFTVVILLVCLLAG